jgi:hypothetical protein
MTLRNLSLTVFAICLSGCAMVPDTGTKTSTKRIVVNMAMESAINPNFVYIFAFQPSTEVSPTTDGPIPVVASPWGNGFVAGNCKYFIRWDPLTSPKYILYRFTDSNMTAWYQVGVPVNYVDVGQDGKTFTFELNLTQLADTAADAANLKSMQINLLTMNRVPQSGTGSKAWDALGDGRLASSINDYITIDLRTTGLYNNTRFGNMEPTGDAPDPSLDISDFSVEVRAQ